MVPAALTEPSDQELLARFESGDAAAFEALYARHRRGLYGFALGVGGDAGSAADAVQDVWLALIQNAARFARAGNVRAYLYKAVRNRVIEYARKRGREAKAVGVLVKSGARSEAGAVQDAQELDKALQALPAEQREVVLLRIYEDMQFAEIAQVTGENIKTVESRHRLALEKLRRWLAGDAK